MVWATSRYGVHMQNRIEDRGKVELGPAVQMITSHG